MLSAILPPSSLSLSLKQWFLKYGLRSSIMTTTWELLEMQILRLCTRNAGGGNQQSALTGLPGSSNTRYLRLF